MRLESTIALITGGNSGIGLATARLFVSEAAKVVITGRNQETLDRAAIDPGLGTSFQSPLIQPEIKWPLYLR